MEIDRWIERRIQYGAVMEILRLGVNYKFIVTLGFNEQGWRVYNGNWYWVVDYIPWSDALSLSKRFKMLPSGVAWVHDRIPLQDWVRSTMWVANDEH